MGVMNLEGGFKKEIIVFLILLVSQRDFFSILIQNLFDQDFIGVGRLPIRAGISHVVIDFRRHLSVVRKIKRDRIVLRHIRLQSLVERASFVRDYSDLRFLYFKVPALSSNKENRVSFSVKSRFCRVF
jgi:hypothetical protein